MTTPSVSGRFCSMPKPWARWRASMSSSTNDAGVEQQVDPLAGGELAPVVLAPDRRLGPGVQRLFLELGELLEPLGHRVRGRRRRARRRVVSHDAGGYFGRVGHSSERGVAP